MDQSYSYPKYFNLKIKIIFVIYSLMSIGNHVGSPMHSILSLFVTHEYHSKEFTFLPQFDNIFSKILTVSNCKNYTCSLIFKLQLHSILGKTTMHFRDIFIVFISIMLRESFKQINKRIRENGEVGETLSAFPVLICVLVYTHGILEGNSGRLWQTSKFNKEAERRVRIFDYRVSWMQRLLDLKFLLQELHVKLTRLMVPLLKQFL